jgi:glycosyltransferase involved in cell wall biosynthesis
MEKFISIVIANRNKAATIGKCLDAAFSSGYKKFEVIVVDDHSDDNSIEVIKRYPCKLIRFDDHRGTSRARNTGAFSAHGEIIFFIDADCLLRKDTLSIVNRTFSEAGPNVIIGGTYTRNPYDKGFFNTFQSVWVHYSETRVPHNPDYIAAHAMIIDTQTFRKSSGFPEKFLPIIEDVAFSHSMQREGYKLIMNPDIQVRHIFNFSLLRSLQNAVRKSKYWTMYSLKNRDTFSDSGTASVEFKGNVISCLLIILFILSWTISGKSFFLYSIPLIYVFNVYLSRRLLRAFYETGGALFAVPAFIYYSLVYPLPVGTGTLSGIVGYFIRYRKRF